MVVNTETTEQHHDWTLRAATRSVKISSLGLCANVRLPTEIPRCIEFFLVRCTRISRRGVRCSDPLVQGVKSLSSHPRDRIDWLSQKIHHTLRRRYASASEVVRCDKRSTRSVPMSNTESGPQDNSQRSFTARVAASKAASRTSGESGHNALI
jgi:hypothetical protein